MSEPNWAALNAALCERLGVEPTGFGMCHVVDVDGCIFGPAVSDDLVEFLEPRLNPGLRIDKQRPIYPDLIADVGRLMQELQKKHIRFYLSNDYSQEAEEGAETYKASCASLSLVERSSSPGKALALAAACVETWVELERQCKRSMKAKARAATRRSIR